MILKKEYRLIQARKSVNLTQEQVANIIGCEKGTISNWENGHSKPDIKNCFALSILYHKDVDWLFYKIKEQVSYTLKKKERSDKNACNS